MSTITGELNPGIVRTLEWLRKHGFETTDSGDGKTHQFGCDLPVPYVHMSVLPASALVDKADMLLRLLNKMGISFADDAFNDEGEMIGPHIEAHYSPADGLATISLFNVHDATLFDPDCCDGEYR